ncbi:DUF5700 domain-containing putative Zn-dependent protease [Shewanella woodyi]|uniref:DUF5700 domain-containing putative Zn-dependent protease n=1 Tax=Shewanella woodyi TaxID=60961 RepID=UPI0007F86FEA|nr:DUF5700 domain-containing putative Zn-dependent protease [Shewanella woodyi]
MKYLVSGLFALLCILSLSMSSVSAQSGEFGSNAPATQNKPVIRDKQYDFTAVEAGLKLIEELKRDKTPSEQQWDELFSLQAYQLIFAISGLTPKALKLRFNHAFKPSMNHEFEGLPNGEKFEAQHLRNAVEELSWLPKYQQWLVDNRAAENATELAQTQLPEFDANRFPVSFTFGLFGQNAHAASMGVVLDPYIAYLSDQQAPYELAAHELHHFFYDSLYPEPLLNRDDPFERALYHIQKEGIANLMDKHHFLEAESPFDAEIKSAFRLEMQSVPANIIKLNDLMLAALDSSEETDFMVFQQALPYWGHTVGWYMSQTIAKAGLQSELTQTISQPRKLFAVYNQAVTKLNTKQPIFSERVLQHYEHLSKQ